MFCVHHTLNQCFPNLYRLGAWHRRQGRNRGWFCVRSRHVHAHSFICEVEPQTPVSAACMSRVASTASHMSGDAGMHTYTQPCYKQDMDWQWAAAHILGTSALNSSTPRQMPMKYIDKSLMDLWIIWMKFEFKKSFGGSGNVFDKFSCVWP